MSAAFNDFKSAFEGDIVTADHADYEAAIARWAANAIRRAKIVAFVKHERDVSLAIKYAVAEKLLIAIRGGGHSTPGASSTEGGLVIDLSRYVTSVRIDTVKKEAAVGGGALWGAVEKAAIEHGLAAVAGTVNHTGVGGLTLGGGQGFLSGAYGYTIDNLLQARVVVADGSVLTANESENTDLFWAIRGSGSNFGVCTEFIFRLHEQSRTVYSGAMIFPDPLVEKVLKLTEAWVDRGLVPEACMAQAMARMPTPERTPAVICIVFFNGSEEDGRKAFKEFLDLKPIDLTKQMPFEELNTQQNAMMYHGQYIYEKAVTQAKYSAETSAAVYKKMVELTSKYADLHFNSVLFVQDRKKLSSPSKNAMAFNNRGNHLDFVSVARWEKESTEYTQYAREACHAMMKVVSDREENPEVSQTRAYGNLNGDVDLSPDRSRMLFGDNYPKLQQLKKKYDPGMIFNKWYPITPVQ